MVLKMDAKTPISQNGTQQQYGAITTQNAQSVTQLNPDFKCCIERWVNDANGDHDERKAAADEILEVYESHRYEKNELSSEDKKNVKTFLNFSRFTSIAEFPDLSGLTSLTTVFINSALEKWPEVSKGTHVIPIQYSPKSTPILHSETLDADIEYTPKPTSISQTKTTASDEVISIVESELSDDVFTVLEDSNSEAHTFLQNILEAFRDNPLMTDTRQFILWDLRCAGVPVGWQGGFFLIAIAAGATPANVAISIPAWVGAALGAAVMEAGFSFASTHYFSGHDDVFTSNSNGHGWKANLIEAMCWGAANLAAAFVWQPAANQVLSDHASEGFTPNVFLVGLATTAAFTLVLAASKGLLQALNRCGMAYQHFRPLDLRSLIQDNILFSTFACVTTDSGFGLTSLANPFNNFKDLTNVTGFEPTSSLTQLGLSGASGWLFGTAGLVVLKVAHSLVVCFYPKEEEAEFVDQVTNAEEVTSNDEHQSIDIEYVVKDQLHEYDALVSHDDEKKEEFSVEEDTQPQSSFSLRNLCSIQ